MTYDVDRLSGYGSWRWVVMSIVAHQAAMAVGFVMMRRPAPAAALAPMAAEIVEAPPVEAMAPAPKDEPPPPPSKLDETFKRPVIQPEDRPYWDDAIPEATKVLTTESPRGGSDFATGDGEGPGYGIVAGAGTGNAVVLNVRIAPPPPPPAPPPPPPPSGPDLSKRAFVVGGFTNECEFPSDAGGIEKAVVTVVVSVRPNGTAENVIVVQAPTPGFGAAARSCALKNKYKPGRDHDGNAIAALTAPFLVRFTK